MLSKSEPVRNCSLDTKAAVISQLIKITSVLYGLRPENLHEDFFPVCFKAICERFPLLTSEDIGKIYSRAHIEKKQGTSLTRDELLQPISAYYNSKLALYSEIKRIEDEEKESLKQAQEHENKAFEIYREYLNEGSGEFPIEFAGYALTMAKNHFASYFSMDEKLFFKSQAEEIQQALMRKIKENQERILKGEEIEQAQLIHFNGIYSVCMVREAIRRRMPAVMG